MTRSVIQLHNVLIIYICEAFHIVLIFKHARFLEGGTLPHGGRKFLYLHHQKKIPIFKTRPIAKSCYTAHMTQEPEWRIQSFVVRELHRMGVLYHGDQNAARRGPKTAAIAKATGMCSGWPDLTVLPSPGHIVFFEFKILKGPLSPSQKDVHKRLALLGWEVHVIKALTGQNAWDQVRAILWESQTK